MSIKSLVNRDCIETKYAEVQCAPPPSLPVYTYQSSPLWVRLTKEVVFHGSSLILIYNISAFCLKKISKGRVSPPTLPKSVTWITTALGAYNNLQIIAGWCIHPASFPFFTGLIDIDLEQERTNFLLNGFLQHGIEVKRISIDVDGYLIDGLIVGTEKKLGNGRWILFSNGNGEVYELRREDYLRLAEELNANALFYNYPAVGRSGGLFPNKSAILASHRAMLSFLEQEVKALEIIDFGHSIGGGIQGENLKGYSFQEGKKYVSVKHMTFGSLSDLVSELISNVAAIGVKLLNWDYSSQESSKVLSHPEIIVQTKRRGVLSDEIAKSSDLGETDGVIPGIQSLASCLIDSGINTDKKVFVGVSEGHNHLIADTSKLARLIEEALR